MKPARPPVILSLLLLLLLALPAHAAGDIDTLARGNQLYAQGDFQAAGQLYEQLIAQGVEDSVLYYNLGNAYYKQGELGRALLNYTRAARLAPRDADIQANLALARSQVADKYETNSSSPVAGLLALVERWLTINELAWAAFSIWVLCALLWLLQQHLAPGNPRTLTQYALGLSVLLLLLSTVSLGGILYTESRWPPAIVLSPEIAVVSGPGTQFTTEFTLHSGAQVSLLETRGDWVRIALPGEQLQGWTPAATVATVAPGVTNH
ncbi:MAG: tetratricopeptide repeat protein [Caldilineaceae bacterium]